MRSSSFNLLCRTANGLIRAAAHPFSAISSPHRSKKMVLAPGWLTGRRWRTASTRRSSKSPTGRKHRRARLPDHALVFPKTSRLSPKTRRLFATSSRVFFSLTRVGAHTQRVFVFCLHPSPPNSRLRISSTCNEQKGEGKPSPTGRKPSPYTALFTDEFGHFRDVELHFSMGEGNLHFCLHPYYAGKQVLTTAR